MKKIYIDFSETKELLINDDTEVVEVIDEGYDFDFYVDLDVVDNKKLRIKNVELYYDGERDLSLFEDNIEECVNEINDFILNIDKIYEVKKVNYTIVNSFELIIIEIKKDIKDVLELKQFITRCVNELRLA